MSPHSIEYKSQIPLTPVLKAVWHTGMYVMAAWFLLTNLHFMLRLRRSRTPYPVEGCRYPVYLAEGLPSPCLFGLLHPAIYLTPAAAESPETLRHVLAHETTHARHGDPLWSLLRCVCLAVYWFDPLVWVAAVVSRRDCELACDEGALQRAGRGGAHPLRPDAAAADSCGPAAGEPHALRHYHDGGEKGAERPDYPHCGEPPHCGRRSAGGGGRRRAGMRPHLHRGKALRAVSDRRGAVRVRAGVQLC